MELPEDCDDDRGSHRDASRNHWNPHERTARGHQFVMMPLAPPDRLAGRVGW